MISITAKKIAGLTPRWARFPGFSILFNPSSPTSFQKENGLEILTCDLEGDAALSLFAGAAKGMLQLGQDHLLETYGFCALPSSSYHVTVFDVVNVADLGRCRSEVHDSLKFTFDALPSVPAFDAEFLTAAVSSELAAKEWNLTFGFGGLLRWGSVLAIELLPLDESRYAELLQALTALSKTYSEAYGVGAGETFTPHLSLGYFMNREGSDLATAHRAEWDSLLRKEIGSATITFSIASLYGFSDMATFFRPQL